MYTYFLAYLRTYLPTPTPTYPQNKVRADIQVSYDTAGGVVFGVPKYASALSQVMQSR